MNIDIGVCGIAMFPLMEKDFKSNKVKSRQYDEEKVVFESIGFDILFYYFLC